MLLHLDTVAQGNLVKEILVVDGQSTDDVATALTQYPTVTHLISEKGRAKQMNFGASKATGEILYFLHADSFPPKKFDQHIHNAITKGHKAGCFRMRFDSYHWWLLIMSFFTQFNSKRCRGGDQSLFITKTLFEQLEGYNEQYIIYEDNKFIKKLYAIKEFTVLQYWLTSSARLYRKYGVWKLQYHFLKIHYMSAKGATADELYDYYKKIIS